MEDIVIADLSSAAHAEAIVYLLNEYARDDMGGNAELSAYTKKHLVGELRKRTTAHVLIAFVNTSPAGLLIAFEGFSTFLCKPLLNIHDVAVIPAYRGKGIARRMLARLEEIALALDCCKLTLEVLEGNAPAQSVYKASGFAGYELHPAMGKALFWQKQLGCKQAEKNEITGE